MTAILIFAYLIGAISTLWFCVHIGLNPRKEKWSTALVFIGWPATLLTLAVIAVWEEIKPLGSGE